MSQRIFSGLGVSACPNVSSLRVEGLSKSFDRKLVLEDITFDAGAGDVLSVIGPSGCGKTTLFRCILGELTPDAGRVLIDGEDVTDVPQEVRHVGIVYQNYALFPHLSVWDNVAYGLRIRKTPKDQVARKVDEMLELVLLQKNADKKPAYLSGGERQRVALARALAVEPRLLLLDEAFTALDATTRSEVVQEVRGIIGRTGVTTLLITHDQEESFLFSKHVLVLNAGKVVTLDEPERVMMHQDPFIQDFVKMCLIHQAQVEGDERDGSTFVTTEGGAQIPIHIPGVKPGDTVHIMVKKGATTQSIEVWPTDAHERD